MADINVMGFGGPNMMEEVIKEAVAGVSYPATKQQLIDSVQNHTFSGALSGKSGQVVKDKAVVALGRLSDRHDYDSFQQVMKEMGYRQKV